MSNPSDIVFTSFIGDALALGPHWVYDQQELRRKFGHIIAYMTPATAYHAGKTAGDLTHYGDQARLLLCSLATEKRFDLPHFAVCWRKFWESPQITSYRDGATKTTLSHLESGQSPDSAASSSADLGGAARCAPLFLLKWENDEALFAATRSLTSFTHGNPAVIEAAEFFVRVTLAVQRGSSIPQALENISSLPHWKAIPPAWLEAAKKSAASDVKDADALRTHGLTCHVPDAFIATCHLLLRHPKSPATGLIENINAGGDSAARGMMLGMVYGAAFPVSALPSHWMDDLHARQEISTLIDSLS
jgi:ADP-ribosylglycohydrolase